MEIEAGPVTLAETHAQVTRLRDLAARAAEHGQDDFALVYSLTADSLENNVDSMELEDATDVD